MDDVRGRPSRRRVLAGGALGTAGLVVAGGWDRAAQAVTPLPDRLKNLGTATQCVVVTSSNWSTSYAWLQAWEKRAAGWVRVVEPEAARLGYHGMIPYWRRVQGDGTTPAGTFPLVYGFGVMPQPAGTRMAYTLVNTSDLWWVGDRQSRYYNQMRRASSGGFRATEAGIDGSEQLIRHVPQYNRAIVIGFNSPPVVGRGTGIFLHVNGAGATAGCVSVSQARVTWLLSWLDPARHPKITIAPAPVVTSY